MSLLTDASLVLVPSAYRTGEVLVQKPLPTKFSDETGNYDGNDPQGSANLTFTRNSNATRVNADGKVERVRTNEVLYSQDFTQTAWTSLSTATLSSTTTITPAGTTDAVRLTATAAIQDLRQVRVITNGLPYTNSAYIRRVSGTGTVQIIDVNGFGTNIIPTSEWQKFSTTSTATSTTGRFYIRLVTSGDAIEVWGCQLEVSDFGPTPYIPTTTSARSTFAGISVDGTSVPNVPRLDYSGGASCPSLLLEPQRTNLYTYSEYSGAWNKTNWTTTDNYAISPEGVKNAFRAVSLNTSGILYISGTGVTGQKNTLSVWAKSNTGSDQKFRFFTDGNTNTSSDFTATTEWQRFEYTHDCTFVTAGIKGASSELSDILFYGFQHEAGSYVSSYIPTLGASVTRLADDATQTDVSGLLGAGTGTAFIDFVIDGPDALGNIPITIGTTTANLAYFFVRTNTGILLEFYTGSTLQAQINVASPFIVYGTRYKAAFAWANNDFVLYINGLNKGTDTSGNAPTPTKLWLGQYTGGNYKGTTINQTLLFPTRLSNADLANLTAL